MKIAFIRMRYDPFGGSELFTQRLIERLAKVGFEVHLFTREWIDSGLSLHRFKIHQIRGWQSISLLSQLTFPYLVGRALKGENFDLIQSHERTLCQDVYRAGDGVHAQWLSIRMRGIGLLRRLSIILNPRHRLLLLREKKLFRNDNVKAVIVNSEMVRREIIERFNFPDSKIHTIYNGVDLERFHPRNREKMGLRFRQEQGIQENIPLLLFLGSGFERKGLSNLIRGFSLGMSNPVLWVVGKGKTTRYRRLALSLGIGDRVKFWGPQQSTEKFYAAADIFVLPTLYDPFPNAVFEAMASGLPTITTAQCGAKDIIDDGIEGYILSYPDDLDSLKKYIDVLSAPDCWQKASISARAKAEQYSIDNAVEQTINLYDRLLSQ